MLRGYTMVAEEWNTWFSDGSLEHEIGQMHAYHRTRARYSDFESRPVSTLLNDPLGGLNNPTQPAKWVPMGGLKV
jgi:hypothetical protein